MNPVLRRCGRTHCTGPRSERPCGVSAASLHAVPSTLLIPLAARAGGGQGLPWLDCHDDHSAGLLDCLAVDARPYLADRATVVNVLWRTALLKAVGQAFFAQHPQALGVNLGCGLSSHFQWLDNGHNHWIDADLPEVAALRHELLPPASPRAGNATVDLSQPGITGRDPVANTMAPASTRTVPSAVVTSTTVGDTRRARPMSKRSAAALRVFWAAPPAN